MNKRAPSLHLRLMGWLVIPLALMSAMILIEVYYSSSQSMKRIQDQMLAANAIGIAEHALSNQGDWLHTDIIQRINDNSVYYRVEGPDLMYVTGYSGLPTPPNKDLTGELKPYFYNAIYHDENIRIVAFRRLIDDKELNGWITVYVGQHTTFRDNLVKESVINSSFRLGGLIMLAALLGWVAVSRGLKPLTELEDAIGKCSFDDLRPIKVVMPREVNNLVNALNQFLYRLNESAKHKKRFIANASHQLRTPVASLMAQTELALRNSNSENTCAELKNINQRVIQMSRLIQQLLTLANADSADQINNSYEKIELTSFAKEVTLDWINHSHTTNIDLGFEALTDTVFIKANITLLRELIFNLIDNANHYCTKGTRASVRVHSDAENAILEVEDSGPGIPVDERKKVLERFYRLHEEKNGTGLGLSIASEVVRKHSGSLELLSPPEGHGLLVRVLIPKT